MNSSAKATRTLKRLAPRGVSVVGGFVALTLGLVVTAAAALSLGTAEPANFAAGVQNPSPDSYLSTVSCPSEGNCVSFGKFKNAAGFYDAYTMTSSGGVWGTASPIVFAPGVQNSSTPLVNPNSLSCVSVGECVAAGQFKNADSPSFGFDSFVVSSSGGVWGTATPVSFGAGVQSTPPSSAIFGVSCSSAGNCSAVGRFRTPALANEGFVVSSSGGVWGTATPLSFGAGVQNASPDVWPFGVSCSSNGNCSAVGWFMNAAGDKEGFVVSSTGGVWGTATALSFGAGVQNASPDDYLAGVSCASAGNCTAVGQFRNAAGDYEGFALRAGTVTTEAPTNGPPNLPATGRDVDDVLRIGLACSIVGALLVVRRRRTPA